MDTGYDIRFSIIITARNNGATIKRCLQSILSQTYPPFEVLVVESGSTDNTVAVVEAFGNEKIKIVPGSNEGYYDGLNKGIWETKGNWMYFLDGDDQMLDNTVLQNITDVINGLPNVQVVFGDIINASGKRERNKGYNFWKLVIHRNISRQAICYHRAVFNVDFFDTRYELFADWDINLKIFAWGVFSQHIAQVFAKTGSFTLSDTRQHPEYLTNFANRAALVVKYKSRWYLPLYFLLKLFKK
ncbi:MAG: glycosyltransferase [Sphingobacteriaceae bacterium]|nr:MAG: glycosyltransferase [Sphingobacteriaceae bacterium]